MACDKSNVVVPGITEEPLQVDFITACALAVKRGVIEEVGLLDARFFIYYDETDWCARATSFGYKTVYVPASKIWHKVSAAMGLASHACSLSPWAPGWCTAVKDID
jgi:GT2 family glycosyltransferase